MIVKFFLLTILTCVNLKFSAASGNCAPHKITIIGKALNSKGSAIVQTEKDFYLIDGLDNWDSKFYGKTVKVSGRLKVVVHKKQSTDSIVVQERMGKIKIIKKPVWELHENNN